MLSQASSQGDASQVAISFSGRPEELWALAQLVKRLTWSDVRSCSVDDTEAHVMLLALERLRRGLALQDFSPR